MRAVPLVGTKDFKKQMTYKTSQEYNQELVVHNHREAIVYGQHNKPHNRRLNYELHILIRITFYFLLYIYIMLSLRVVAAKTPDRRKVVEKRRKELKSIRTQLSNMAEEERKRAQELWDMHKNMVKETPDDNQVIVVEPETIDDFFEN